MADEAGRTLWAYLAERAARIEARAFEGIATREDWEARRTPLRRAFMASVGLDPLPTRCALALTDHGGFEGKGYRARKIAYQILPDGWATATVYYPEPLSGGPHPAVLYACGHATIGTVHYQQHGMLWARRGYVCLVFDTVEQHDHYGDHHGTCSHGRFDWLSLGYSAAGGELWNSMRALDVLSGLPEVDPRRIGATGCSGGGAHSFFLGIADERVRAVASSCGISTPRFAVEGRHVSDHCDCMYYHNAYGIDTAEFAALMAPRPLLLTHAAKDSYFGAGEIRGVAERARRIYDLYGCADACAHAEFPGPHGYHPVGIRAEGAWFARHVAGDARPDVELGEAEHPERTVSVFDGNPPAKNHLALLPELLTPIGGIALPQDAADWPRIRTEAVARLRSEVFERQARLEESLEMRARGEWLSGSTRSLKFSGTLGGMDVWAEMRVPERPDGRLIVGCANQDETAQDVLNRLGAFSGRSVLAVVEPRGAGLTAMNPARRTALLRAGALVGVTPVSLMLEDLARLLAFVRARPEAAGLPVALYGRGDAAAACVYHALLNEEIAGVVADAMPGTHRDGAYLLGILRVLDIEHAVGLLAPRPVALVDLGPSHRLFWGERAYARVGASGKLIDWKVTLRDALKHVQGPERS
ncbi:MAG: acetylxylan esterase [Planctomycetota bacterium]|nr:acetylxylan esterase [Planctomycetota bacterium]